MGNVDEGLYLDYRLPYVLGTLPTLAAAPLCHGRRFGIRMVFDWDNCLDWTCYSKREEQWTVLQVFIFGYPYLI